LELNSTGHWPFKTEFGEPWFIVSVLLEGQTSAQSNVVDAHALKRSLYFAVLSNLVAATEKHPHGMMLLPPDFTVGMGMCR